MAKTKNNAQINRRKKERNQKEQQLKAKMELLFYSIICLTAKGIKEDGKKRPVVKVVDPNLPIVAEQIKRLDQKASSVLINVIRTEIAAVTKAANLNNRREKSALEDLIFKINLRLRAIAEVSGTDPIIQL